MSEYDFYPEPPHLSTAFYFDSKSPVDAFIQVCEQVEDTGAISTGVFEVVRANAIPQFSMISDLTPRLEALRLDLQKGREHEWKRLLNVIEPSVQVIRAAFDVQSLGLVTVAFEPIPDDSNPKALHPIAVSTSGALLSMPGSISLSKRERQQAVTVAGFMLTIFRSVCESLDPLYGTIQVEKNLPTPRELILEKRRVGTELFVSNRLCAVDTELERELALIFRKGFSEHWKTGIFFSGWAPFNLKRRTVAAPLEVGTRAALRLGRALTLYLGPAL